MPYQGRHSLDFQLGIAILLFCSDYDNFFPKQIVSNYQKSISIICILCFEICLDNT